jgi:hypothetical protein
MSDKFHSYDNPVQADYLLDPNTATDQEIAAWARDELIMTMRYCEEIDDDTLHSFVRMAPHWHTRARGRLRREGFARQSHQVPPKEWTREWYDTLLAWIVDTLLDGFGIALLVNTKHGLVIAYDIRDLDDAREALAGEQADYFRNYAGACKAAGKKITIYHREQPAAEVDDAAWFQADSATEEKAS